MPTEIKLPELGENIESGDVLRVMVKPGESVKKDQALLELETDKATIEVPSAFEGTITEVKVKPGEKVKVGQTIVVIEEGQAAGAAERKPDKQSEKKPEKPSAKEPEPEPQEEEEEEKEEEEEGAEAEAPPAHRAAAPQASAPKIERRKAEVVEMKPSRGQADQSKPPAAAPAASGDAGPSVPAAPSVRRLARELGISLQDIQGSGDGGRISMEDVTAHARRLLSKTGGGRPAASTTTASPSLPDFSRWGAIQRKPMGGVRRTTAHRLTQAWNTVPHVFQQDWADISALETLRKRLSKNAEAEGGGPVTLTAFLVKVLGAALRKFPQTNSSVDLQAEEIIYKQYIHVGVAVDTERGLLVPVIRDVDTKDIGQLAGEIAQAAEKARNRKLSLEEMQGGSITISNLGSLGGGPFMPIINWPEVAILGVSRARMEPVFIDGEFVPRFLMPLTLSYDHRVIDGADGVRILRWIVEAIEQPALIWLDQ
jgi:pyruvate dehydrogenase E2 component (dihydrolipoamide acetyltransferase)